jgi:hypothetical protein
MSEQSPVAKFASEREAVMSDAKDSDLVSVNLFSGSVSVYRPNAMPDGSGVPSCYPLGRLGKLRAAPTPSLLVSAVRAFVFVIEPPEWNYAVISDPSLPESVQVDTSFFPEAVAAESGGRWTMALTTLRHQAAQTRRQIHRSPYFYVMGEQLFSPSGQNITSIVESFRVGDSSNGSCPLNMFVAACRPNEAVSRMTLAELKRLERAINNLDLSGLGVDADDVLPREPYL